MKLTHIACVLTLCVSLTAHNPSCVITNQKVDHSRIGDILTMLVKGLWVTHINNLLFHHVPCTYTNATGLKYLPVFDPQQFVAIKDAAAGTLPVEACTAYTVGYRYGEDIWGPIQSNNEWQHFKAMQHTLEQDELFMRKLRATIKPLHPPFHNLPHGMVTVAIHMRTGGQYHIDTESLVKSLKTRFMPDTYYIWALKQICALFPNQMIYAHIFTDDGNFTPRMETMAHELAEYPIVLNYRAQGNRHDAHILEDLWSMTYYQCLIRPWSQYSFYAELLGNHEVVVFVESRTDETVVGIKHSDGTTEYTTYAF